MPLLGPAAMLLTFDIAPEAIAEHDDWHTHEHLPERLSIPGFLRGTRWISRGSPRYMVLYEVAALATLNSPAYLERLNNPTPWTRKMMPHYRGMSRGLCSVGASFGLGVGHVARLVRFKPGGGRAGAIRAWLVTQALPALPSLPGVGAAHLVEGAATAEMTNEQRIRGSDAGVDSALIVTGYREDVLAGLAVGAPNLGPQGAAGIFDAMYAMDYSLVSAERA